MSVEYDVSVVIVTHNGSQRLEPTLSHLEAQSSGKLAWELVVVDNASTDDTAVGVRRSWRRADVPLRVVEEPRLGTAFARFTGCEEARGRYVLFVDDDNWLAPDYLAVAVEVMDARREVGACGGQTEAVFDGEKPRWIDPFLPALAIGEQCYPDGRSHEVLWGAGLIFRREAWSRIVADGFRFTTGRRGEKSLAAGEDNQLCRAIAAQGWRIRYEPRLRLKHFLPRGRLTWSYLCRLHRGIGESSVPLELPNLGRHSRLERTWTWRMLYTLRVLGGASRHAGRWVHDGAEGDPQFLVAQQALGRLRALWNARDLP